MSSKILDIKDIRGILVDHARNGGMVNGLGVAKKIADFYGEKYGVYRESTSYGEPQSLPKPEGVQSPTFARFDKIVLPWVVLKSGSTVARFESSGDALKFLLGMLDEADSGTAYTITHDVAP